MGDAPSAFWEASTDHLRNAAQEIVMPISAIRSAIYTLPKKF
jgi:hypothetical protein